MSDEERIAAARRVFDLVEQTAAFTLAEHILMYHSLPDELSTREFIDRWSSRKSFYLPRVNGVNLDILPYDRSRLHLGAFNIEEPTGDETADIADIELIIVPGVAYDRRGNRIGRGKDIMTGFFAIRGPSPSGWPTHASCVTTSSLTTLTYLSTM